MAKRLTQLGVFISGPSDTLREQQLIARTIRSMNYSQLEHLGLTLQAISWKENLVADFGIYSQDVINRQFDDKWDIYIGVLWARHGTPTPKASSGTEEEFDRAYKRWKANFELCKVAVFFSEASISPNVDIEQLQKVQNFRKKVESLGGVYTTFGDSEDFAFKVRDYLSSVTVDYGSGWGPVVADSLNPVEEPTQPTTGSILLNQPEITQLFASIVSAFIPFLLSFQKNMSALKIISNVMSKQTAELKALEDKSLVRLHLIKSRVLISASFVRAAQGISANLPDFRKSWGALSSPLFSLLSHTKLEKELTPEMAQNVSSQLSQLVFKVEEARQSLGRLKASYAEAKNVSEVSKVSLINALEALDNEYAFIADECTDIDVYFSRKMASTFPS